LGAVKELMEGVQLGTIDMTLYPSPPLATLEPSVNAFQLPGVIPNCEGFAKIADSAPARAIMDTLEKHDMIALGLYKGDQRHFLTTGAPLTSIAVFTGLKTHVAPVKLLIDVSTAPLASTRRR
jgi:TRAP-type transport system periplasmic protein